MTVHMHRTWPIHLLLWCLTCILIFSILGSGLPISSVSTFVSSMFIFSPVPSLFLSSLLSFVLVTSEFVVIVGWRSIFVKTTSVVKNGVFLKKEWINSYLTICQLRHWPDNNHFCYFGVILLKRNFIKVSCYVPWIKLHKKAPLGILALC